MKIQKVLFGAAVVFADVLAVTALPRAITDLHKKTTTHAHLYTTVGVYAFLCLMTLWVVVSIARAVSKRGAGKTRPVPAARPGYGSFRGGL